MIHENIFLILTLLFAVSMLSMLAQKLRISAPIFLVIAGLAISFIPGVPAVNLDPDIVFLIFLPPLLYAAAWNTSWKDFWQYRRPIGLLSFGLVIFTSTAVAFIANAFIPDFPLAYGFLLGGIISPPDAVAATSVLKGLKVPKRVVTILEGESLINDASSLVVFRFALAAIITGQFSFVTAGTDFFKVVGVGILCGLAVAFIVYAVHKYLPTTASIDTALTLISPYIMYISAEYFHCSGVLAVVAGGLLLSNRSHEVFNYNSRIQSVSVWEMVVFLLNGLVFILIGLQLPQIIAGLEENSVGAAIIYAIVICTATVVIRVIWVFPGAYLPRILSKSIRTKESRPNWKSVLLLALSGMRGVVSLASALAIPLTLGNTEFPHRNLLLFITFVVIFFTLVVQGLSLPWIIRKLNVEEPEDNEQRHSMEIKKRLAEVALGHITGNYEKEINEIDAYSRIRERYQRMIDISHKKLKEDDDTNLTADFLPRYRNMLIEVVAAKRKALYSMYCDKVYSEELIRHKEWELDLEEARLNEV